MDDTRKNLIRDMFLQRGADFHAIICRLPQNVVMLTGYQPILGNSFCIVTLLEGKEVEIRLAVPEDEVDLVPPGTAVEVKTYSEETMDYIGNTIQSVRETLAELLRSANINENAVIGYEGVYSPIASAYTQVGAPGPATLALYSQLFLGGYLRDVTPMLDELAAVKTEQEIEAIKRAESAAYLGFIAARESIAVGSSEVEVAAQTYAALLRAGYAEPGAKHVLPHVHVMAGKRAALVSRLQPDLERHYQRGRYGHGADGGRHQRLLGGTDAHVLRGYNQRRMASSARGMCAGARRSTAVYT